jgi:hypothetical protein
MKLERYKKKLKHELVDNLLQMYVERIHANPGREHKHINALKSVTTIIGWMKSGSFLGTVVPGYGNLAGTLTGLGLGLANVGYDEVGHLRKNKKIDNAGKVEDFLGQAREAQSILYAVADRVIDDRSSILLRVQEKDEDRVVWYLAVNIMAAVKRDLQQNMPEEAQRSTILEGLKNPGSSKPFLKTLYNPIHWGEFSHQLKDERGNKICTLEQLAENSVEAKDSVEFIGFQRSILSNVQSSHSFFKALVILDKQIKDKPELKTDPSLGMK